MMKTLMLIWLCVFSSICNAAKIVGTGVVWPPFFIQNDSGQGIAVEIVTEALKREGYELEMKFLPWARAVDGVKKGSYDALVGVWWTEKRTKFLSFSDHYLENSIKFIKLKDDDFEYNGLSSLDKKKVGIVRDYGYGDEFLSAKNFNKPIASSIMKNLKKLVAKRIDLTLGDEIVTRALIANQEDTTLIEKIAFTENALSINKLHFGVGLVKPNHKTIIDKFNSGLKKIKSDGTFNKLMMKYNLK
ncbi:substrate-binding periplasmic protein [Spartinivicinus poritis]|uniref:Transporter substrate-binding domain-containing protein n=1 Tax=Spartinivicinus poritis TaxID=2994640 RepID=A0ABT5U8A0_9GAMM|nr:transporter substrate-binding domain-containing protein [Spartinivicinus sp. A2-2]MDE1462226.1 transporter substrate-binding domain-containing protein [Spartinivicinus sp. A2-2]